MLTGPGASTAALRVLVYAVCAPDAYRHDDPACVCELLFSLRALVRDEWPVLQHGAHANALPARPGRLCFLATLLPALLRAAVRVVTPRPRVRHAGRRRCRSAWRGRSAS